LDLNINKYEHVLSEEDHSIILNSVQSESFPWYLIKDVAGNGNLYDITQYAFRHRLWWENNKTSEWANLFDSLILFCGKSINGDIVYVPKVFLNMNMKYGLQNKNMAHCDGFMDLETDTLKRYTGVYYLNDSDGDTLFYDSDGTTIVETNAPKANTMVIFPSGLLHSRQLPLEHNTRLVLNINVLVDLSIN
jgi:hypothetical protein